MSPSAIAIVAAMLALGALALGLLLHLGRMRLPLVFDGKVRIADVALDRTAWPDRAQQASNAFDNQFQLPVLFYVAAGLCLWFGATPFEAILAIAFVASRYVHAVIHVTTNNVPRRFTAYVTGLALLSILWLDLVVRLVLIALGAS